MFSIANPVIILDKEKKFNVYKKIKKVVLFSLNYNRNVLLFTY